MKKENIHIFGVNLKNSKVQFTKDELRIKKKNKTGIEELMKKQELE